MNAQLMHEAVLRFHAEKTDARLEEALLLCQPLLAAMARRLQNRGIEYEDLYQTACLACVQAIKGFDPERGLKFSTYLTPTVMGTLQNYIRDKQGLVHTPRSIRKDSILVSKERARFLQTHHQEPTPRELAEILGWDLYRVLEALQAHSETLSMDQTDEEGLSLGEKIPHTEAGFALFEMRTDMKAAMAKLTDNERKLIQLRFAQQLSQRQTAQQMGTSQMQISRMERRILLFLKKEMEAEA
ncbi:MAG: sigma-70 family RNA polymerase sigma factor [Clostridia bacterium]|nr:sigma-70 family RNA polymerase sigma factor [Clostridia bacterium]